MSELLERLLTLRQLEDLQAALPFVTACMAVFLVGVAVGFKVRGYIEIRVVVRQQDTRIVLPTPEELLVKVPTLADIQKAVAA